MANLLKELGIELTEKEIIGDLIDDGFYSGDFYASKEEKAQIEAWETLYNEGYPLFDIYG